MPTQPPQDAPALEDYADFLAAVDASGVGFAVIGGAAVGLYARLLGEAVISADLDIVVSERELPAPTSSEFRRCRKQPNRLPDARPLGEYPHSESP